MGKRFVFRSHFLHLSPKANEVNFENLNNLLQGAANSHLATSYQQVREDLRAKLTAAVTKVAPGATTNVAGEIDAVTQVVMADKTLLAELNAAAKKAGIKDVITYLRAALAAANAQ